MANFIHQAGTNGFLVGSGYAVSTLAPSSDISTSLTSSQTTLCSVSFSQTNLGPSAQYGYVVLTVGASFTPASAGCNIAGWWLNSIDGGTTWESTNVIGNNIPLQRSPDFLIPLSTHGAEAGSLWYANGPIVPLPYGTAKLAIQNNAGVTMGASAQIKVYPVADTYA
jgi:hypothetical protein